MSRRVPTTTTTPAPVPLLMHMHQLVVSCNFVTSIVPARGAGPTADMRGCMIDVQIPGMRRQCPWQLFKWVVSVPLHQLDRCSTDTCTSRIYPVCLVGCCSSQCNRQQCSLGTNQPAPVDPRRPRQLSYMCRTLAELFHAASEFTWSVPVGDVQAFHHWTMKEKLLANGTQHLDSY